MRILRERYVKNNPAAEHIFGGFELFMHNNDVVKVTLDHSVKMNAGKATMAQYVDIEHLHMRPGTFEKLGRTNCSCSDLDSAVMTVDHMLKQTGGFAKPLALEDLQGCDEDLLKHFVQHNGYRPLFYGKSLSEIKGTLAAGRCKDMFVFRDAGGISTLYIRWSLKDQNGQIPVIAITAPHWENSIERCHVKRTVEDPEFQLALAECHERLDYYDTTVFVR